ncbi:MAG TPA: YciI family protein [Chitinophagaceae bacterium]
MKILFFFLFISSLFIACSNEHKSPEVSITQPEKYDLSKDTSVYSGEMKRYWLVLLQKGPNRNQDSISAEKIQAAHMANINRLAKEGKLVMAGPIGVEGDLRGIFLMNCADSTEVENFVKTDSAVITGRLIMKYYPWWTEKGKYIFK